MKKTTEHLGKRIEASPGLRIPEIHNDLTRRDFLAAGAAAMLLGGCGGGGEGGEGTNSSGGTRTIEHKFGSAEIPENVERVAAVGFNEADFVLALGVVPVGARDFIGPYPEETRPWAREELDGEEPELVGGEEINFEAVAALEPDLILGIYSFMTQENYDLLAEIAPTVAQPAEYEDGGTPWQEQMLITGRALGMEARAEEVVAEVEASFDEARESHPEFEGKTAAVTFAFEGEYSLLEPSDLRTLLFTSLGLRLPEETGPISRERVDLLDEDVLIFLGADRETLEEDELVQSLASAEEGRIVYFGDFATDFAGALGYSSPLSLPFALEEAVPQLAAAVDGDPETEVESAS
ncbi:MAG: ABC transporter substrate-binding protein [Rubrobacteraceae bacterium]|jgi:iron complex transport system substrate-binding protein